MLRSSFQAHKNHGSVLWIHPDRAKFVSISCIAGNSFQIHETITGKYYYPNTGMPHSSFFAWVYKTTAEGKGEISETSRPRKAGEIAEFVLLDGTPSTCANIGLYNLYHNDIDLVVSGFHF